LPYPPSHKAFGTAFIELQSVDSTNNYALSRIHAGLAQHGEAIFAHEQTAGKGQRGKKWTSSKGDNIALSIILQPAPLLLSQQFQLSITVATAINEFFRKYAGDDSKIKWPNDVYWKDRKAGGVLIESIVSSRQSTVNSPQSTADSPKTTDWQWAVVGIGLNVNQVDFGSGLVNPVSLKQITGKSFNVIEMAKEMCLLLDGYFERLVAGKFEEIYAQYLSHLYKINETVKLKKDNRVFDAVIKTVSRSGKLIVQHSMEEEFDFGEIEWVMKAI
jgi:BirA family biotin operon repressor/biotin-[acetyl-CoA-carboxylase] ligase